MNNIRLFLWLTLAGMACLTYTTWVADHGAQEVFLVDQVIHRLPGLDVVEGRVEVVEAN